MLTINGKIGRTTGILVFLRMHGGHREHNPISGTPIGNGGAGRSAAEQQAEHPLLRFSTRVFSIKVAKENIASRLWITLHPATGNPPAANTTSVNPILNCELATSATNPRLSLQGTLPDQRSIPVPRKKGPIGQDGPWDLGPNTDIGIDVTKAGTGQFQYIAYVA